MGDKKNSHKTSRFSNPVSYKTIMANAQLSSFIKESEE